MIKLMEDADELYKTVTEGDQQDEAKEYNDAVHVPLCVSGQFALKLCRGLRPLFNVNTKLNTRLLSLLTSSTDNLSTETSDSKILLLSRCGGCHLTDE